ncbi:ATP-binding cassette domain-containing protein [Mediterraneibacter sp. ICN-202921]|uniref:ATP-binding cassette domain-containing protein n=1 Tax=Mediterraneibacter sp. ICN-202921 TaxID=3134657 RepID=UPI000E4870B8|nr:sugar ABC transporter ATP-binding protein [Ruminococcus sp. AF18-22]
MKSFCIQTKSLSKTADRPLLTDIDFTAFSGEIHAIIGNNGEGKTVFAKLLSGVRKKTSGSIFLDGTELHFGDPSSAQKAGIYILQQEPVLFPELSVRDNITLGVEKHIQNRSFWAPSAKKLDCVCRSYLKNFGLEAIDLHAPVSALSAMEKLMIQLCRILICNPKVLILDEPSALLTTMEIEMLFQFLKDYKKERIILLITHNYSVLLNHCDRVSFMSDGQIEATFTIEELKTPSGQAYLERLKMSFSYPSMRLAPGNETVNIRSLSTNLLSGINFSMHQKEIVSIAGLKREQKDSLIAALLYKKGMTGGSISFPKTKQSPIISVISDSPAYEMLFETQSVPFNITASDFRRTRRRFFTSVKKMRSYGKRYFQKLHIKDADIHTPPMYLSTGTKQKVILARSLFKCANIYIYDEPTKNLDSTSKLDFYNILNALALEGASILLISSDYSEMIGMSSRIILVKNGCQTGNYSTNYLSVETLSKELE